jgi:hypothetical protein
MTVGRIINLVSYLTAVTNKPLDIIKHVKPSVAEDHKYSYEFYVYSVLAEMVHRNGSINITIM